MESFVTDLNVFETENGISYSNVKTNMAKIFARNTKYLKSGFRH